MGTNVSLSYWQDQERFFDEQSNNGKARLSETY